MAELFVDNCKRETVHYAYNNRSENGINRKYAGYHMNMDKNIIYIRTAGENHREIEQYFQNLAENFDRIQLDEKKLGGMPAIKNTRIPVSLILACLKDEMTMDEICEDYMLAREDIESAVEYAIEILDTPYQEGME